MSQEAGQRGLWVAGLNSVQLFRSHIDFPFSLMELLYHL